MTVSGGPTEQLGRPVPATVDAFGARFDQHRLAGRDACCAALVADAPDLGLELFRRAARASDESLAAALAAAFERCGDDAPASSVSGLRADRARHRGAWEQLARAEAALAAGELEPARAGAREAREVLSRLGDRLGASDADVVLAAATDDAPGPALVRSIAEARIAALVAERLARKGELPAARELVRRALALALATRDLALAQKIEGARAAAECSLDPGELGSWVRFVAGLALDRGQPLVALRSALEDPEADPRAAEGSLLVARAQLASGQASVALDRALGLSSAARASGDRRLEGEGDAVAAEALVALDRAGDAAGSFERAAELALETGDAGAWVRRLLNAARAHLRRGEPAAARGILDALERRADGRSAGKVALVRALELASGEGYALARAKAHEALVAAASAGDSETVERASELERRLEKVGS